jgi:hypothetical protein
MPARTERQLGAGDEPKNDQAKTHTRERSEHRASDDSCRQADDG